MKISNPLGALSLLYTIITCCHVSVVADYDIRCEYPEGWEQNLFYAMQSMSAFFVGITAENKVETPIVIRIAHQSTMCRGTCLALHYPDVLDPFDFAPTFVTVPEYAQDAHAVVMCIAQCVVHPSEGFFDAQSRFLEEWEREYGMKLGTPESRQDIRDAYLKMLGPKQDSSDMIAILEKESYHPYTMGHVAGFKVQYFAERDGFNVLGDMQWSQQMKKAVPCTGSCRPYQDTVGYAPKANPRTNEELSTDSSKYECTGYCTHWQPLQEGNAGGSLKQQEFITPHIGPNAKHHVRKSVISLPDPQYDYKYESDLVIERMRNSTGDLYQQDAIVMFDDKNDVRSMMNSAVRPQFAKPGLHVLEDELLYKVGLSAVEYDAVIHAWHEKLHHDKVRPTTVIKHWDDDDLYTYSGVPDSTEPVWIKARDFEAAIRVMPHPEYPSGSSCLCTAYQEYADLFMSRRYGKKIENIAWGRKGRSYILKNLEELKYVCGQSRLWGGMHYTAAIEAGETKCSGLAEPAYDMVTTLKNGSTWRNGPTKGPFKYGDEKTFLAGFDKSKECRK